MRLGAVISIIGHKASLRTLGRAVAAVFCISALCTSVQAQYVAFEDDIPTEETLAETERRAPVVVSSSESQPARQGFFRGFRTHRREDERPAEFRLPKRLPTLPALEPGASDAQIASLEKDLNEPYQHPQPAVKRSTRGPIKRVLLFWKPEPAEELRPQGPPPNVIVADDPRQADRDWDAIIRSLPPEPANPTIEIFLSRQAGRYKGQVFPALGGNRYATPKGNFRVGFKSKNHYSRKYDSPMPYSLFFTAQCAIHEGSLYLYSHGCIHVNRPTAQMLFDEAVAGKTPVVVRN